MVLMLPRGRVASDRYGDQMCTDDIMLACVLYVLEDGVHRTDEQIAESVRELSKDQVVEAIQNWSLALASLDAP